MKIETVQTADLLKEICMLQSIQKQNPPATAAWNHASRQLDIRFKEMARR